MYILLIYYNLKNFILWEKEVFFQNIAIIYILVIRNITILWKRNYRYFGSFIVNILCRLPFCCPIWRTMRNQESLRLEAIIVHDCVRVMRYICGPSILFTVRSVNFQRPRCRNWTFNSNKKILIFQRYWRDKHRKGELRINFEAWYDTNNLDSVIRSSRILTRDNVYCAR